MALAILDGNFRNLETSPKGFYRHLHLDAKAIGAQFQAFYLVTFESAKTTLRVMNYLSREDP